MTLDITQASNLFWTSWEQRRLISDIPSNLRPQTREDGYAIQSVIESHSALPLVGWKIAATSDAGQRHINVSGPMAGRIVAERVHTDNATISLKGNQMSVAEPEFVFVAGNTLEPRNKPYDVAEVMSHIAELRLGIEIPDSRFASFTSAGEALLIADNACAHEFILGPCVTARWTDADLSKHEVFANVEGPTRRYARAGIGANVLSDPRVALTWLVNELSRHGRSLCKDQFVTTGTCMAPLEVVAGDHVWVDYGLFGNMQCRFT